MGWRIVIGADDAGADYAEVLRAVLERDDRVDEVLRVDGHDLDPYPQIAEPAARLVASGAADRGLLVCGTGLGMAITANKVQGIRAVTAHDSYSVERSVLSNNAQVLTLGARVIGIELAKKLVTEWLDYQFDPSSPSAAKVDLISEIDKENAR